MPSITCPCGRTVNYPAVQAGRTGRCPGCGRRLLLPPTVKPLPDADAEESDVYELAQPAGHVPAAPTERSAPGSSPGDEAVPLQVHPAPGLSPSAARHREYMAEKPPAARPNFWLRLPTVFIYPLRGDGLFLLVCGVAFFTGAWWLANSPRFLRQVHFIPHIIKIGRAIMTVLLSGYFAGYVMKIIAESGRGDNTPPNWPDMTEWIESCLKPLAYVAGVGLPAFGALWAYRRYGPTPPDTEIIMFLKAWGCFYAPMGVLAVAVFRDPRSLNPWYPIKAIVLVAPRYLAVWVLALLAWRGGDRLVSLMANPEGYAVVWHAGFFAALFYASFVVARALGVLYFTSHDQLKWIEE